MEEAKDSTTDLLRRTTMEFIGTFFLVLNVSLISVQPLQMLQPFIPGLTLMVMVFVGGHISLGSFNPAVTLALTLRPGLLSWKALLFYTGAELLAGLLAGLVGWCYLCLLNFLSVLKIGQKRTGEWAARWCQEKTVRWE
jgi:glycerol uptake facilitator-like aquaporin